MGELEGRGENITCAVENAMSTFYQKGEFHELSNQNILLSHSLQFLQTVQILPFPHSDMFCAFDLVAWLVFQAVLAPLALPCSPSPTVHSRLLPFPP